MKKEKIIIGAGCFWGVQYYFDQVPGVIKTTVGYSGGRTESPSYEQVCYENTGHAEIVFIEYDQEKLSTVKLLKHFFRMHDCTQLNMQGPDVGDQYRSVIFYYNEEQKKIAEKIKMEVQKELKDPIVTQIEPATNFYEAEEYHQKYVEKTGRGMCHIPYSKIN